MAQYPAAWPWRIPPVWENARTAPAWPWSPRHPSPALKGWSRPAIHADWNNPIRNAHWDNTRAVHRRCVWPGVFPGRIFLEMPAILDFGFWILDWPCAFFTSIQNQE